MDARRRTIALSQDGPLGNGGYGQTGIPIPGSTMKKPALRAPAARMSMAPAARVVSGGSSSLAPGLGSSQDGGAGIRRSTMAPPPGARGGMGGLGMGVTPQSNRMMGGGGSVRRQSHFPSAGRPSVLPGSQKPQDPRPIRSAGFQQSCRESIETFCRMHRCPVAMTEKTLVSPTAKDFFTLFKWLYNEFIDPAYAWPAKNLVDDITAVLRDLRYPALDSISKTSFSAPGDTRSWPLLLALLSWLVDLAKAQAMWQDRTVINDPLLISASEWPANHDLLDDRLLWDYVSTMYVQWFQGAGEEFPEAEQELREAYDRIQQATLQDADELETLVQRRTAELQTLQAQEPPLKQLEDEYIRLKSDQSKFIAFIELHKQKADKIRQGISKAKSIVADNELIMEAGRAELAHIEAAVAAQNLSPDEVQRMNADRDNLQRQIEDLRVKIGEASQHSYDQEMAVTKLMDRFDSYVSDYTQLAHSIGTIQPLADVPGALGPGDVDYSIDIETTMEDIAAVQAQGRRLRHEIWPALQAYSEGFRREMAEVENQHIQVDDEHDRLAQRVERQKEEAANLEMKLGVVHEQAEEARSRFQAESSSSNQAIQKLENEVAQIQMSTRMGVQDVRSAIETTQIEFKELRHKTAALQDSLSREILSHVDVIVKAKEHASAQFQSVRAFAEATQ